MGWGVRTLATDMGAYNPASYHNGSVWPHDNAVIAAGLMRYGFVEEAQRIATALFDAAAFSEGRLPELFCGFGREQYSEPVPYPTACSPQAWAATSPIQLITSLMRYDATCPTGGILDGSATAVRIRRLAHHQRTHGRRQGYHRHCRFGPPQSAGTAGWDGVPSRTPAVVDRTRGTGRAAEEGLGQFHGLSGRVAHNAQEPSRTPQALRLRLRGRSWPPHAESTRSERHPRPASPAFGDKRSGLFIPLQ